MPPEVEALLRKLEVIPLKIVGGGTAIDVEASSAAIPPSASSTAWPTTIRRAPNPTRWQDVQDLLGGGIKVIASINVQYIAELRDQVEAITGKP